MDIIDKKAFDYIVKETDLFNERTNGEHSLDYGDVIFTFFNPGMILYDWDEGENNDPYWDKVKNMHSVESVIEDICNEIKSWH